MASVVAIHLGLSSAALIAACLMLCGASVQGTKQHHSLQLYVCITFAFGQGLLVRLSYCLQARNFAHGLLFLDALRPLSYTMVSSNIKYRLRVLHLDLLVRDAAAHSA